MIEEIPQQKQYQQYPPHPPRNPYPKDTIQGVAYDISRMPKDPSFFDEGPAPGYQHTVAYQPYQQMERPVRTKQRTISYSQDALVQAIKIFAPMALGLFMIFIGLTSTGSYYAPASRFGGFLAEVFYVWQAGTFAAIVGAILIYDAVKRTGYL